MKPRSESSGSVSDFAVRHAIGKTLQNPEPPHYNRAVAWHYGAPHKNH
jgi:hypothetical protein